MSVAGPDAGAVGRQLNVSRETIERLEAYVAVLRDWRERINLVGRSTMDDVWGRHVLDSGQLFRHLPEECPSVMDVGSGAGLPGLVLAAIAAGSRPGMATVLVESDGRKCAFLEAAADAAGVKVEIRNERVENLPPLGPAVITARAVAPLEKLIAMTRRQHHPGLQCLFMKGATHKRELTCLDDSPNIAVTVIPSVTSPEGAIIRLEGFTAGNKST